MSLRSSESNVGPPGGIATALVVPWFEASPAVALDAGEEALGLTWLYTHVFSCLMQFLHVG